jgi:hypothetical protein
VTDVERQASNTLHSLLLNFVSLGKQAEQLRSDPTRGAAAEFRSVQQQSRIVIAEASRLSAVLDKSDQNRKLFSAAVILAAGSVKDPRFERELMDLWASF